MSSLAGKVKAEIVCTHCTKRIKWAWVIKYRSYRFTQYVYVCSQCGRAIKTAKKRSKHGELQNVSELAVTSDVA
ncbi:MAG: hypothetical protein FJ217_08430 [Ignavibacteria bacterium]|nr:hypothetical protein [Ignavibacteria bacterium]